MATSAALDDVVAMLDNSVCIVTTVGGGERSGCLIGFASQVSIDPARFLAGISVQNRTYQVLQRAKWLAVQVLSDDQHSLAELFGAQTGDDVDKFAQCEWRAGPHDVPVLAAAAGWFVAKIVAQIPLGDHVGFLVEPEAGDADGSSAFRPLRLNAVLDISAGHDE